MIGAGRPIAHAPSATTMPTPRLIHGQDVGRDPVLHLAQHARGLDAGAEAGPPEQDVAPQPSARLDHEERHQEGQHYFQQQHRRADRDLLEHRRPGQHHLGRARFTDQVGQPLVGVGEPGKLLLHLAVARSDLLDQFGQPVEQRESGLQDRAEGKHHDRDENDQREHRGERVGHAP